MVIKTPLITVAAKRIGSDDTDESDPRFLLGTAKKETSGRIEYDRDHDLCRYS